LIGIRVINNNNNKYREERVVLDILNLISTVFLEMRYEGV
jgi:hypothetical protein